MISSAPAESPSGTSMPSVLAVPQIDHELELARLHDRQVGRLLALENPRGIDAGETIGVDEIGPVARKAARLRKLAPLVDRRKPRSARRAPRSARAG